MIMKTVVKFVAFRVLCPVLLFFRVDKLLQIFSPNQRLITNRPGNASLPILEGLCFCFALV